jgi:hypothetical protein
MLSGERGVVFNDECREVKEETGPQLIRVMRNQPGTQPE